MQSFIFEVILVNEDKRFIKENIGDLNDIRDIK